MSRYGIVIDLNRCTGCMTCVIACKQENLTRPNVWWDRVLELESKSPDRLTYIRYACMHCDDPPCVDACSNSAIHKRPDGLVLIDYERCTGAGDCVKACPYGAIDINPSGDYFPGDKAPFDEIFDAHRTHPPGKFSTCTMCAHRIDRGREPACVEGCPSKAMTFGDLDDPESPIQKKLRRSAQLLSSQGTNPKVSYIVSGDLLKQIEQRVIENPRMER